MRYFSILLLFVCFYACNAMKKGSITNPTEKNAQKVSKKEIEESLAALYKENYTSGPFYSKPSNQENVQQSTVQQPTAQQPDKYYEDWIR